MWLPRFTLSADSRTLTPLISVLCLYVNGNYSEHLLVKMCTTLSRYADCWSLPTRDKDGRIETDLKRFPSGMKALADYVHSKGTLALFQTLSLSCQLQVNASSVAAYSQYSQGWLPAHDIQDNVA
jgi:hypothetical protein